MNRLQILREYVAKLERRPCHPHTIEEWIELLRRAWPTIYKDRPHGERTLETPGSEAIIRVYMARAEAKQAIFHPLDDIVRSED